MHKVNFRHENINNVRTYKLLVYKKGGKKY